MATNPALSFGGLASGLDTNAIIDGLLKVESIPLQRNQSKQQNVTSAKSTLSSVLSALTAVKTAAQALDTASEFAAYDVDSSDSASLTASSNGSTSESSYNVKVNSLAAATRAKSDVQTSATAALGQDGTFDITIDGTTTSVDVTAGDSLTTIASNINATSAAVTASVVTDMDGSYLRVVGQATGAANAVTFATTGSVSLMMKTYQNAADAEIAVDGQFTFRNSTNTFSNAIEGLTLTAKKVNTTGVTVAVASDVDGQAQKIQSFVDAYNNAVTAGHLASGWGGTKASNPTLAGDSAVRSSLDLLAQTVSSSMSGLSGKYNQLAAVGVSLTQGGSLKLDKTKLKSALAADAKSVAQVFIGDSDAGVDGAMKRISNAVDRMTKSKDGIMTLRIGQFDKNLEQLKADAETLERRIEAFEANLRKRFTSLEDAVSKIQFQSRGLNGFIGNPSR